MLRRLLVVPTHCFRRRDAHLPPRVSPTFASMTLDELRAARQKLEQESWWLDEMEAFFVPTKQRYVCFCSFFIVLVSTATMSHSDSEDDAAHRAATREEDEFRCQLNMPPREPEPEPLHRIKKSAAARQREQEIAELFLRQWKDAARRDLEMALLLIQQHDTDYAKRAMLVYNALALAARAGLECGVRIDVGEKDATKWPVVVIKLPTGEVAWHCAAYPGAYDGHSTEEKYKRIAQWCSQ
jgi:hypothetical protein